MTRRIQKLNRLMREELGKILVREMEFGMGVLVTITRVETSSDTTQSKVYVSVLPEHRAEHILNLLTKKSGYLQGLINKKLSMRFVPKIVFVKEKQSREAARIEELLGKIGYRSG